MITRRWLMDEWRDTFVMELRLHQVSGQQIGEALAEVDSHCADSGETPAEAFGDPTQYAASVARDTTPSRQRHRGGILRTALIMLATISGIVFLLEGASGAAHHRPAIITAGELATMAFAGLGGAVAGFVLRPGQRGTRWQTGVLMGVGFGCMSISQIVGKGVVAELPAWPVLAVGAFLFATTWWPMLSDRFLADRVVDPRTGAEPFTVPWVALAVVRWGPPVLLLCALAAAVALPGPR